MCESCPASQHSIESALLLQAVASPSPCQTGLNSTQMLVSTCHQQKVGLISVLPARESFSVYTTHCLNISPSVEFHCRENKQINSIKSLSHFNKHAYHREDKLCALCTLTNTKSTSFRAYVDTISSNLSEEFLNRHRPQ